MEFRPNSHESVLEAHDPGVCPYLGISDQLYHALTPAQSLQWNLLFSFGDEVSFSQLQLALQFQTESHSVTDVLKTPEL